MDIEELTRLVDAKPAPVPLLAVQAFANTIDLETESDLLSSPSEFRDWLLDSELAAPGVTVSRVDLDRARDLRDTIRALLLANTEGRVDSAAAAVLGAQVVDRPVYLAVDPEGGLDLDLTPVGSAEDFISDQIGIVFRAHLVGEWERLKLCRNDACRWSFYDSSRNRGGTWCQMQVCGNRIKNRHYRQRHRSA
jgi:predicted RNA-binding Zn ribbon-like protein